MRLSFGRISVFPVALCLTLLAGAGPGAGQGLTAELAGNVLDPSRNAIGKARIVLSDQQTGRKRETVTADSGDFIFTELLPGTFDLRVEKNGFQAYQQQGIVLSASERRSTGSIALNLGTASEAVTVRANAASVQSESGERSDLLDATQMQRLSLKGRDYLGLLPLIPGVVDSVGPGREAPGVSTLQGLNINGNRQGTINLTLDGISMMDTGGATGPYYEPNMDAIAEVKVLLSGYQAEYGRTSGGAIVTVTRNGTASFHGGAYYFFRNEDLNANDFFNNSQGLARPRYRYNNPGYNVGGPVLIPGTRFNRNRDKLFFFWSEEFLERTYPTSISYQTFPTMAERQGIFSTTVKDPQVGTPFPGNVVPPSRFSPGGQALLNLFPVPNAITPNTTYNAVEQSVISQPRNDQILRLDWNVSPATQFYVRGIKDYEWKKGGFGYTLASPAWPQLPIDYEIDSEGVVATLIHTFGRSRVNEVTVGSTRGYAITEALTPAALNANTRQGLQIGLPQFYPQSNPLGIIPNATFGGISDAPQLNIDQRFPYLGANTVWEYADNYSQVSRGHYLKFGVYVDHAAKNIQLATSYNGTIAFDRDASNPLDTGYAFSNALLGVVDSYSESSSHPLARARDTSVEWYAQDRWKVFRRLTVDAGVRFYWIDPTSSAGTQLAAFDPSLYSASAQPQLVRPFINPANAQRVGLDPVTGQLLPAVTIGSFAGGGTPNQAMRIYNGTILHTPPVHAAPRLGFGWDPFGDGKTAVRGGFGIYYDRFPENQVTQLVQSPPLVNTPVTYYTAISTLLSAPLRLTPGSVFGIQTNYKPPAAYNWNFGIQRDLGWGTVLDVAYVGDVSRHGMQIRDLNATNYGTDFLASSIDPTVSGNKPLPANFLRPLEGYGSIQYMEFASNSNYNALQTRLNKRLLSTLTFGASYSWSKVLDVADTPSSAVNPMLNYDSRNYGPALFDHRQTFVVNYVYSLPQPSQHWNNGFSRLWLDGWRISGIASFIDGPPVPINYTFATATDITGASGVGIDSRVDLTCNPNLSGTQRSFYRAFNTSCVQAPTLAELGVGNASKYPLTGPGTENFDISLHKHFSLGRAESRWLEVRLEGYNAFNHTQFTAFDNNARFNAQGGQVNTTCGQYNAAAPGRRVVLGAKFYF